MERLDAVVIGAGVVGLAAARALALAGREVVVLESTKSIGSGTSSRNSEVVHAGIYYPTGSLKARLCVEGKGALYTYCRERGVPHRNCGKLIVATDDSQVARLHALKAKAADNGVHDLVLVDPAAAREMEPELSCVAALWSPSSGIIDSHALMLSYLGEVEDRGGAIAYASPVLAGRVAADGIELVVGGDSGCTILARTVVNAAGLHAQEIARLVQGIPPSSIPALHLAKGNYYALAGRNPFSRLVYPIPEPGGLGVHVTIDLGGQARFGPDVEWVQDVHYDVDPARAEKFYSAVRRYWPGLKDGALVPGYAGIRPKLAGPGQPDADFLVQGPASHGVPGLVNLYGIESPGLTASITLGDMVVRELQLLPA